MNPLHLSLRNCRTFQEIDLDIPEGLLAIIGENGAGKSTLINAIDVALFGPQSRTLADWYPRGGGEDPLQITLTFEHDGETYRVRRSFSPKGRGTSKTDLEELVSAEGAPTYDPEHWAPLTLESQTATQEKIEALIGLSRDTFRASSFLAQREATKFCDATAGERKRILAQTVGADQWAPLLERARAYKAATKAELDKITGRLEAAEEELSARDTVSSERRRAVLDQIAADGSLKETLAALTTAREALAEARVQEEKRLGAQEAAQRAEHDLSDVRAKIWEEAEAIDALNVRLALRPMLEEQAAKVERLEEERETLRVAEAAFSERGRLLAAKTTLLNEFEKVATQITGLVAQADLVLEGVGEEHCDRCGQVLGADAAQRASKSYRDEAATLATRAEEITNEELPKVEAQIAETPAEAPSIVRTDSVARELSEAQGARTQLAALAEVAERRDAALAAVEKMRAEVSERERFAASARANLATLGPHNLEEQRRLEDEVKHLIQRETVHATNRDHATRILSAYDERLTRLDALEADVSVQRARRDDLHRDLDLAANMEKACGPNGVPALILETVAIPQVEVEATRILGLLGGPAYACELRTQRETKTGTIADALDIVLFTENGEAPYETFSGGEQARISFALSLALAQLLAGRKGSATGLLVIDELEGLDAKGVAALVSVLEDLQRSVPRIIVVSHNAELRDSFPNTLLLEQVDGRSQVVTDLVAA